MATIVRKPTVIRISERNLPTVKSIKSARHRSNTLSCQESKPTMVTVARKSQPDINVHFVSTKRRTSVTRPNMKPPIEMEDIQPKTRYSDYFISFPGQKRVGPDNTIHGLDSKSYEATSGIHPEPVKMFQIRKHSCYFLTMLIVAVFVIGILATALSLTLKQNKELSERQSTTEATIMSTSTVQTTTTESTTRTTTTTSAPTTTTTKTSTSTTTTATTAGLTTQATSATTTTSVTSVAVTSVSVSTTSVQSASTTVSDVTSQMNSTSDVTITSLNTSTLVNSITDLQSTNAENTLTSADNFVSSNSDTPTSTTEYSSSTSNAFVSDSTIDTESTATDGPTPTTEIDTTLTVSDNAITPQSTIIQSSTNNIASVSSQDTSESLTNSLSIVDSSPIYESSVTSEYSTDEGGKLPTEDTTTLDCSEDHTCHPFTSFMSVTDYKSGVIIPLLALSARSGLNSSNGKLVFDAGGPKTFNALTSFLVELKLFIDPSLNQSTLPS
ncbi:unnamed protein product [Adineta ricciae]|uniref:Uncharacterized protein n=1 Tax=Adineta ricciae TaxID=249248 RepID=A0A814K248_ADIRI|nr:unnamed protein product [Adineta ricciae]CAF1478764.1 unnamed protein product [Adineta ricciae]